MPATSNRASIKLYNVEGISRHSGEEKDGAAWLEQFYSEIEDSAIEAFYEDERNSKRDLSRFPQKTMNRMLAPYFPQCCVCHRRIAGNAWICLDGGEYACDSHVKLMTESE